MTISNLKFVYLITCLLVFILSPVKISAGPFLNIDKIDAGSEFPKVRLFVTVKGFDNSFMTGLNEDNLLVYEDGYRVNYVRVKSSNDIDSMIYIIVSMDSSKSISEKMLSELKKTAVDLIAQTQSREMIALFRFNDKVEVMNSFSANKAEIVNNLKKVQRHGKYTLLYNSLYDSIELLKKANITRKSIIVFTDGKDEGSAVRSDDIIKYAREAYIPIYCVTIGHSEHTLSISRIAKLTGGRDFNVKEYSVSNIYRAIISRLMNQYVIEYQSIMEPDSKPHLAEVRLKYDSISDRDQREFVINKKFNFKKILSVDEIILYSLILILIASIIFIIIYSVKKINSVIKSQPAFIPITPPDAFRPDPVIPVSLYESNEDEKYEEESDKAEPESEEQLYTQAWLIDRDETTAKKIQIRYGETTFGSDSENNVVIADKKVSPKHAKIKTFNNSFYLFDLASNAGTYLNDKKLLRPKILYDWDEIKIGKKTYIFRGSNIS